MIKEQGNFVRECGENYGGDYGRRSNYEAGNRALGVIGTVAGGLALLSLWNRGGNGIGNLLGGGGSASGMPTNVNINGGWGTSGHCAPTAFEAYTKSCEDAIALTSALYNQRINSLQEATAARNVDVNEKFGLYKSQIDADFSLYKDNRDNIDRVNNRINDELFSLYKYTRDKDDETNARLCKLEKEVAVNTAIRPYQDKLITSEIEKAYTSSINYTDRKTCRAINGIVTLPNTPTVTGFPNSCGCNSDYSAA